MTTESVPEIDALAVSGKWVRLILVVLTMLFAGAEVYLMFVGHKILRTQNELLQRQAAMSENQAVVSLIGSLDLPKAVANKTKISQLLDYGPRGQAALLRIGENPPDPAVGLNAFEALFTEGRKHDAGQATATLNAWSRRFGGSFDYAPKHDYAVEFSWEETAEFFKYLEPMSGYLHGLGLRVDVDSEFRAELRKSLLEPPLIIGGLAVFHHAFLKHDRRLEEKFKADNPDTSDFPTHQAWHDSVFRFAKSLAGEPIERSWIIPVPPSWSRLRQSLPTHEIAAQSMLRIEIRTWFGLKPR